MAIYTGTTTGKRGQGAGLWFAIAAVIVAAVLMIGLFAVRNDGAGNAGSGGSTTTHVQTGRGAGSGSGTGAGTYVKTANGICARCAP